MPSAAETLRSWVRIPLEEWISAFILFALQCVGSGLATGSSPVQAVLPTVHKIHNFRINSEWEQEREPNPSS
jgi:hypothetical protein